MSAAVPGPGSEHLPLPLAAASRLQSQASFALAPDRAASARGCPHIFFACF